MKKTVIGIVLLCILIAGCTQNTTPETPAETQKPPNYEQTEPSAEEEQFTTGTFALSVQQCYGDKLRILNNGTGTVYMDSTVKLQSTSGYTDYGSVTGNTTIQPKETKIVSLSRNLHDLEDSSFSLYKEGKSETGGTIHYRFKFNC